MSKSVPAAAGAVETTRPRWWSSRPKSGADAGASQSDCGVCRASCGALPRPFDPPSKLGISVWVKVILDKYLDSVPVTDCCRSWQTKG